MAHSAKSASRFKPSVGKVEVLCSAGLLPGRPTLSGRSSLFRHFELWNRNHPVRTKKEKKESRMLNNTDAGL